MKQFLTSLFITFTAILTTSCSQPARDDIENNLRDAEMQIAQGDMTAAQSAADYILGNQPLDKLTPRQLGRLSLIYMQISDSTDSEDPVSHAADCYRAAYAANPDSADMFYSNVPTEHTARATLLSSIVHSNDIPTDSLHLDD